jgi:hypothetical protein
MVCDDLKAAVGRTNTLGAMRVCRVKVDVFNAAALRIMALLYHLEMLYIGLKTARLFFFAIKNTVVIFDELR